MIYDTHRHIFLGVRENILGSNTGHCIRDSNGADFRVYRYYWVSFLCTYDLVRGGKTPRGHHVMTADFSRTFLGKH